MLTTLDLFILLLVREGIPTPYGWQSRAKLSTGATLPAIRRLLSQGLVKEAEEGRRGRREFTVTPAGRRELQNLDRYFEEVSDEAMGDLDSVLRLACIAIVQGKSQLAKRLLLEAAEEHGKRSRRAKKSAVAASKPPSLADLYASALTHCEGNRQDATARSLESLVSLLRLSPSPTSPSRRRSKRSR